MSWADAVALAAKAVRRRPGRALLTLVSIALASALLTALLTLAVTAETRVLSELANGGPLAGIRVAAAEPAPFESDPGSDELRTGAPRTLDDAAVRRIRAIPGVRSVLPVVSMRVFVTRPDERIDGTDRPTFQEGLVGVDLRKPDVLPLTVLDGRLPDATRSDEIAVGEGFLRRIGLVKATAARVLGTRVVLGSGRLVDTLDGSRVRARWQSFKVVGVVSQEAASGDLLVPIDVAVSIRTWSAAGVDGGAAFGTGSPYSGLFVIGRGIDAIPAVRERIAAIGFASTAPENLIAQVQRYFHVVEIVLTAVGAIALAIAAAGTANAMLAAVRERRREIGVLKAIGARDRDVRRVFLCEAGALGFVGGLVGTAIGWTAAMLVASAVNGYLASQGMTGVAVGVPPAILGGSVVATTLLAVSSGTFAAVRAARLSPREAVAS